MKYLPTKYLLITKGEKCLYSDITLTKSSKKKKEFKAKASMRHSKTAAHWIGCSENTASLL